MKYNKKHAFLTSSISSYEPQRLVFRHPRAGTIGIPWDIHDNECLLVHRESLVGGIPTIIMVNILLIMVNIWLLYGYYIWLYLWLMMINNNLVENWLVVYHGWALPLWKMMDFVNGKDDIPYMKWEIKNISQLEWLFPIYGNIKMFQTTNQSCSTWSGKFRCILYTSWGEEKKHVQIVGFGAPLYRIPTTER